ncbi:MAG: tRNA pseudouridine(38-40) synthase TruA [Kiloniellales bacterium]|nr:tRNA pseudouridine(38-40) synthase TruA [Kiloniellales bacterium]
MTRFKLTLEYDGGVFVGWQRQDNGPSVQQALEEAVTAFCGERARVHGAGRTDAGVHALGQVAHLDLEKPTKAETLRDAVNHHLKPAPVAVLAAEVAAADFHARFSATERRYLYRIVNRRAPLALERGRAWWVPRPLDAAAMHAAAQVLVGKHDFSSFRASECQARSPVKTLTGIEVSRLAEAIEIRARAPSFLHHQVRNFAGTLRLVGEGKWSAAKVEAVLAARDRSAAGQTAPAEGLYLTAVGY